MDEATTRLGEDGKRMSQRQEDEVQAEYPLKLRIDSVSLAQVLREAEVFTV